MVRTGSDSEGASSQIDYDWNTDDELEVFGVPSSAPTYSSQESCEHSVAESSATCSDEKNAKLINLFVGMGFSRVSVIKAINENGEENEEDILETLLTLTAIQRDPASDASSMPCTSAKKSDIPIDISEEDSCPGTGENPLGLEKDETLSILVDMGYPLEEALSAMDKCGPEAQISELADFISAAQLEEEIDSLQDPPNNKHDTSVYMHKKPNDQYYLHKSKKAKLHDKKWKSKICRPSEKMPKAIDKEMIHVSSPMTGFGVPNELCPVVERKLPSAAAGQPYFYFENVALAPAGVWSKISRFLYEIEPEFVDSKFFCAATRKRGYIHNLPIHNRSPLLPIQPLTIQEALPTTKMCWPSWDERTKLNCLLTNVAPGTVTDRIRKVLDKYGAEPPAIVQRNVLQECRRWNLVWVGKNNLAPLEPDEYEMILGFPRHHTRGGGITRTERYRALGNAFQVDTVAYHLSVLKGRFPNGINVLSLFSGIGGAEVALHRLGIMLKNVVSVEIAEMNRNIIRSWWERTNQRGNLIEIEDVQQVSSNQLMQWITKFGGFDLIIGGSPCNNLSGSNRVTRHGLEGEHSSLFYEYFRIVEAVMDVQRNPLLSNKNEQSGFC
ncbi:DNA (cytosine-5)-methyltransferase DRM2-like [Abrus precatorius]|uniref:DNA (cytosine-5-)-methyltransferase n=1 Tax=Abrus precatorius TaxID=3816 RepID=A0A8B8M4D4_ABRPR|nr:DNA (cytosine-5)-methyltransferase DRM2-like [Abrus precatorius]